MDTVQSSEKTKQDDADVENKFSMLKKSPSLPLLNTSDDPKNEKTYSNRYIIKPDWLVVLKHPTFETDYINYIRNVLLLLC